VPTTDRPGAGGGAETALIQAERLMSRAQWHSARIVLRNADRRALDPVLRRRLRQQLAISTYKDGELRLVPSLERALDILASAGEDLATTSDAETLGIAGAIHKRIWRVSGNRADLLKALAFYLRGAQAAAGGDDGYTAINAAFLLDSLADADEAMTRAAGLPDDTSPRRRAQAHDLRQRVLDDLRPGLEQARRQPAPDQWWRIATAAEAALGLGDLATARDLLALSQRMEDLPSWMLESTVRQLAALARLHSASSTEAADVLARLVDRPALEVLGVVGKVGLALSGGGLRASFFHLGVLARLAELDVLRHIEVLSCVSGGSIVGAHYYLELRRRMQGRNDAEMTREEYVDVVRIVQRDFYRATLRNLRRRALTNPVAVLRTLFEPGYNRTVRLGRALDRYFYRPITGGRPLLAGLRIQPAGGPDDYEPRHHNWRRSAKVPLLIINATSLNTGHNWQFTTSWMGEPSSFIDDRTDANYRLDRVRITADQTGPQAISLGQAVAASASVPGLLEPWPLDGLYPGKAVRLADGGVDDNLGTTGLLEEDCDILLISDASGQLNADDMPPVWPWSTMWRSTAILMGAVRTNTFRELEEMRRSGRLGGLMFVHLKRDLRAPIITPQGAQPSEQQVADAGPTTVDDAGRTSYGIPRIVQRALAGLRTDLDVFSAAEANTLMLSGYRMAGESFAQSLPTFPISHEECADWPFQAVASAVDEPDDSPRLRELARALGARS
jgi:predicted acylesterase/phospholipase RssA